MAARGRSVCLNRHGLRCPSLGTARLDDIPVCSLKGRCVGKHAVPAGPEGRAARRELRAQRAVDGLRFGFSAIPVMIAGGFMEQRDVPWFWHPFLIAFGAVLPLAAVGLLATAAVNAIAGRRARRRAKPALRLCYLFMALGWAAVAAVFRLLGWAVGGGPDGTGDWIVTAVGWSFMISVCAAFMMISGAITARPDRGPEWLARLGTALPSSSSGGR